MAIGIGLLKNCNFVQCLNAVAAGTSNQTGNHVDMQGYDGVTFILSVGTLTATQQTRLKAQGGNLANDSDQADLSMLLSTAAISSSPSGTTVQTPLFADANSNTLAVLDIYRPNIYGNNPQPMRYVRPVVLRGTANAVINVVIAILWQGSKRPTTLDATVAVSAAFGG